ncbi:putative global transcription activator SNF2L1 [Cucumispora dikerogammari]|nr:putative global transcription activator SNF2L1 [Cucumispora dikerogammari]
MKINISKLQKQKTTTPSFVYSKTPDFITGTLRSYQLEGLNWMISMYENGINAILADEMGLGKTLQTICFLTHQTLIEDKKDPHLLIVPKSILINWKNEFKKFSPKMRVFLFHGMKDDMKELIQQFKEGRFDVVVTTYEMILKQLKLIRSVGFDSIVIDEAHRIKNDESQLSLAVRMLTCDFRLLLTGTPLQNNIKELWSLLNFLSPEEFKDSVAFEEWVETHKSADETHKNISNTIEDEANQTQINKTERVIHNLRTVLSLFFLRREKAVVEKNLPPKKILHLYPSLTEMERKYYKNVLQKNHSELGKGVTGLSNIICGLRKACNHPYLFDNAEPRPVVTGEHLIKNSCKLTVLDKLLKLKYGNHKILIFSQWTAILHILEDYCNFREYSYVRIDGTTSTEDRASAVDQFMTGETFIFLISTRAGGLGLNLTAADTVIFYDSDWNPQVDLQAMDRAHRIGQTKVVTVYRLVSKGTIEEKMIFQALCKLKLGDVMKAPGKGDLLELLASGTDFETTGTDDILELIKEGEIKTKEFNAKLEETDVVNRTGNNIYEFEGEKFIKDKLISKGIISETEDGSQKRTRLMFMRAPVLVNTQAHQFYPKELINLQNREMQLYRNNEKLPEEEVELKNKLSLEGFDWSKRDFHSFIRAMEIHGENNYSEIAKVVGKNVTEIKKYSKVFFSRIDELEECEQIKNNLQKAVEKRENDQKLFKKLEEFYFNQTNKSYKLNKLKSQSAGFDLSVIPRSKNFSESEDCELLKLYYLNFNEPDVFENIRIGLKCLDSTYLNFYIFGCRARDVRKRVMRLAIQLMK